MKYYSTVILLFFSFCYGIHVEKKKSSNNFHLHEYFLFKNKTFGLNVQKRFTFTFNITNINCERFPSLLNLPKTVKDLKRKPQAA